ncbi:PAS domain S-box protein [Haloarcula sp. JP-L23]|uniref:PAS domain S-box protein n=1 Tax=Haloarcula sp. JP-L23 TaxID=2716717 RepID=UPI00140F1E35|nr:PAS domain S-box protein [Haloarcula sp. JP-L23]
MPNYEVIIPDSQSPKGVVFDLCIVDFAMLETHWDTLRSIKRAADPTFLPYLFLSSSSAKQEDRPYIWEIVDEVISVPTRKETLYHRLSNLLERREMSVKLSDDLDHQRELFHKIFKSSNDAILIIDPEHDSIRQCNPQASDMLGYSPAELCSLSPADLHPTDLPTFRTFQETVLKEGQGRATNLTCKTKGGENLYVEISASAIELDGSPHMVASIRNVTTRTEQQQALSGLHDVTSELMRASSALDIADITVNAAKHVFSYDIASVRLLNEDTNPQTLEIKATTAPARERLGSNPPVYEIGEGFVGQVFDQGEPEIADIHRILDFPFRYDPFQNIRVLDHPFRYDPFERLRTMEIPSEYEPIRSVMCFPLGTYGTLSIGAIERNAFDKQDFEPTKILSTNTTAALARAQREQRLHERNKSLSALFENTTDCIVDVEFVDGEPRIQDVNPAFERVFGYERDEVRDTSLGELVVPTDEEAQSEILIEHALSGQKVETEARRETATGRRDFLIRIVPIQRDESTIGAYIVYTDISDQKRHKQQLQVLNRVLRHNIRNKLNIVRGVLERARNDNGPVSESLLENGLNAADELLSISETVRPLSEDTQAQNNTEPISVFQVVDNVVCSLRERYPCAELSMEVASEQWVAGTVQVEQALEELCENAIVHAERQDPSVRVTAVPAEAGDWVEITVRDTGPGIPDDQQLVFQRGEETQLEHSNGLGLWIVQWIVTKAGGELTITEPEGKGSTVTMQFPTVNPKTLPKKKIPVSSKDE